VLVSRIGDQLRLRREETMTELTLAGEGGDRVVGVHPDPAIELLAAGAIQPLRAGRRRRDAEVVGEPRGTEADDQRAAGPQELAPLHARAPFA